MTVARLLTIVALSITGGALPPHVTFTFSDGTYDELSPRLVWTAASSAALADLYMSRQRQREEAGAGILPHLLKSLLSYDRGRNAVFLADIKTVDNGWVQLAYDPLDLEEITVGQWNNPFELALPAKPERLSINYNEDVLAEIRQ
ncbi:MAG: hypothetical protein HY315_05090 [Acidobacteria bacterium]|nr:hypothetical protein [Acidobacteriota bacterium]